MAAYYLSFAKSCWEDTEFFIKIWQKKYDKFIMSRNLSNVACVTKSVFVNVVSAFCLVLASKKCHHASNWQKYQSESHSQVKNGP